MSKIVIELRATPPTLAELNIELAVVLYSGGKWSASILKAIGEIAALKACERTFNTMNRVKESTRPYAN